MLLPTVGLLVFVEISAPVEALATGQACVEPLTCVSPAVCTEERAVAEMLPTHTCRAAPLDVSGGG